MSAFTCYKVTQVSGFFLIYDAKLKTELRKEEKANEEVEELGRPVYTRTHIHMQQISGVSWNGGRLL